MMMVTYKRTIHVYELFVIKIRLFVEHLCSLVSYALCLELLYYMMPIDWVNKRTAWLSLYSVVYARHWKQIRTFESQRHTVYDQQGQRKYRFSLGTTSKKHGRKGVAPDVNVHEFIPAVYSIARKKLEEHWTQHYKMFESNDCMIQFAEIRPTVLP